MTFSLRLATGQAALLAALLTAACSKETGGDIAMSEAPAEMSGPAAGDTMNAAPAPAPSTAPAAEAVGMPETRPDDAEANEVLYAPDAPAPPTLPAASGDPVELKYLVGDVAASDPVFVKIPATYSDGNTRYGHKDAVTALAKMFDAAKADGIELKVVSGFRSFRDQKRIWEDKWTGKTLVEGGKLPETIPDAKTRAVKILEFSSMPASSRHHWGTDFDINNLTNSYFEAGRGKAEYEWLTANAGKYGFCQVYSAKGADRPRGYNEERWHWSYLPVASTYLAQYPGSVGYEKLTGFAGSETARGIAVIEDYVEGINPQCRE
jgi:D-alanyl-D-alanine carboxypeptidase